MKLIKTKFKGLIVYQKDTYKDNRGYFRELFLQKHFNEKFPFDVMSYSKKNVLRGLHLQLKKTQAKLITVLQGKIFDVCVDCRKKSKTFGKYFSIIISQDSEFSFYIPKGFAHGFLCLSKDCTVNYRCSQYRHKKSETTLQWNDKDVGIRWPIKKPILSKKDKIGKNLDYFKK